MTLRIGSLFSGYGGLDLAVSAYFGAEVAWYSEIEPAACRVLEAHHPNLENLGDVTTLSWDTVEPVDIITGGYPCQPFSLAGQRKGTKDERHLWPYVREAISVLRPRYVVLENVRGHLSLGLDTVLADLASLGMSAEWGVIRASDAGAPHRRERVFIIARDNDGTHAADSYESSGKARINSGHSRERIRQESVGRAAPAADADCEPDRQKRRSSGMDQPINGSHISRENVSDPSARGSGSGTCNKVGTWGPYESAVLRWEPIVGRRAPDATVPGRDDRPRLSPYFVEWMMGLPEGWVTGHGLSTSQELKMLGNGVVPQQAFLALDLLGVD